MSHDDRSLSPWSAIEAAHDRQARQPERAARIRQALLGLVCSATLVLGVLGVGVDVPASAAAGESGVPVPAQSATPGESAAGAVGTADAVGTVSAGSYRLQVQRVSGVGLPKIVGEASVGRWLRVDAGDWHRSYTDFDVQWLVEGAPVGAGGLDEFRLRPGDLGSTVAVEVTGWGPRRDAVTVISAETDPVARGVLDPGRARVTGKAVAGRSVTVVPDKVGVRVRVSYQWQRNGRDIHRATSASYRIPRALRGSRLSVAVTYRAAGYESATVVTGVGRVR